MASMEGNLTTAEASGYRSIADFSVSPCGLWATYTLTRGRMIAGPHEDGGKDLIVLALDDAQAGQFELVCGASALSGAIWTVRDGMSCPVVRVGATLLLFTELSADDPEGITAHTLLELPEGSGAAAEGFAGSPVCAGDTVIFATAAGAEHPALARSYLRALSITKALAGSVTATWLLYATPPALGISGVAIDPTATTVTFTQSSELAHHNNILTLAVTRDPAAPLLVGCEARVRPLRKPHSQLSRNGSERLACGYRPRTEAAARLPSQCPAP